MSILEYTALELAGQIKKKEISCREAVEAVFGQIEKKEKELNCYISLDREEALKQADEVQKKIEDGALTGPLAGVPAAVKDNICTRGRKTTCASKILSDFVPPYDAFAVKKLKEAGCIELPFIPEGCTHNAHMFYIKAKDLEERSSLIRFLKENDISTVFHYIPLHDAPAGKKYGRFHGED